jgi:hypothetical protein
MAGQNDPPAAQAAYPQDQRRVPAESPEQSTMDQRPPWPRLQLVNETSDRDRPGVVLEARARERSGRGWFGSRLRAGCIRGRVRSGWRS